MYESTIETNEMSTSNTEKKEIKTETEQREKYLTT
jgi:hypothetical protein